MKKAKINPIDLEELMVYMTEKKKSTKRMRASIFIKNF